MISEKTAREIDDEVRRIIDESIERVRHILEVRKDALIALTDRLMEVESVDSAELKRIIDDNSPGPVVVPGTAAQPQRPLPTRDEPAAEEPPDEERAAN